MAIKVSKSTFKPHALEYFRKIEETGEEVIITDHGNPVLKVVPYSDKSSDILEILRGSVLRYKDPTEPVGVDDWESLK